jgi:16S rRNA (guanine527-N7)-methyltransferase
MILCDGQNGRVALSIRDVGAFAHAFGVSRETADRFGIYIETLVAWQKAVNLIAPASLEHVWQRHVADSAQIYALAPTDALRWVDLGSGAGFPGLVLALLLADRRGAHVTLIESDTRKCAFLREVVRKTGLGHVMSVDILSGRVENPEIQAKLGLVDVVTARALAPLDVLLGYTAPLYGPSTVGLFPKGRDFGLEVEAAKRAWAFDAEFVGSRTDIEARIVLVRRLSPLIKA